MNENDFARSLRAAAELFEFLGVFESCTTFSSHDPSEKFRRLAYSADVRYADLYRVGLANHDYSFLLNDLSYVQYYCHRVDGILGLRYAFYPNPYDFMPYSAFLEELGMESAGADSYEMYLEYLSEANESGHVPPIRYDLAYRDYEALEHPTSHLHLGLHEDNRWPLDRVLTPLAFSLLIAKMFYSGQWKHHGLRRRQRDSDLNSFDTLLLQEKSKCSSLDRQFFSDLERRQFFIG